MTNTNYVYYLLEEVKTKNSSQAKAVYNFINKDKLNNIITDGDRYWIELTNSSFTITNGVHKYIKGFMNKKGYKYLYD